MMKKTESQESKMSPADGPSGLLVSLNLLSLLRARQALQATKSQSREGGTRRRRNRKPVYRLVNGKRLRTLLSMGLRALYLLAVVKRTKKRLSPLLLGIYSSSMSLGWNIRRSSCLLWSSCLSPWQSVSSIWKHVKRKVQVMNLSKPRHATIVGRTGTGKSHLLKRLVRDGHLGSKIIVIDVCDEYEEFGPGREVEDVIDAFRRNRRSYIIRVVPIDDDDVSDICDLCLAQGDVTLIVEEVSDFGNLQALRKCLRRGRSEGVQVVCVTQRPAEVSKTITSQSKLRIYFKTEEPVDLEYIRKKEGQLVAGEVQGLDESSWEFVMCGEPGVLGLKASDGRKNKESDEEADESVKEEELDQEDVKERYPSLVDLSL